MVHSQRKFAKALRFNMTNAESILWSELRNRRFQGIKFRRQYPIGMYIVDFICLDLNFIIEVDGGQHLDSIYDQQRDAWLRSQGFEVVRFWNNDILHCKDGVLETLRNSIHLRGSSQPPHPTLSLKGRGKGS
jgi:very-short-patch-repair endonuclease